MAIIPVLKQTDALYMHLLYFAWTDQRVQPLFNYVPYCVKLVVIELLLDSYRMLLEYVVIKH